MIDYALLTMWLALFAVSKAAILPLFVLCIDLFCYQIFTSDFPRYCITSLTCFNAATVNFTVPEKLRYALLASGAVYWCGAIDELLYNQLHGYQGFYYAVIPWLVILLNTYIAALIFMDGGHNFDRVIGRIRRVVNRRAIGL